MKLSKKLLSLFLILLIMSSVAFTSVYSANIETSKTGAVYTSGDYEYTILSDGTIEIVSYWGLGKKEIIIPSTIDNYTVSTIGEYTFALFSMEKVIIPNTIVEIKESAFNNCENLNNVIIPSSVKFIGDEAFHNCYSLQEVTIENGVETIGNNAFGRCFNLSKVSFPESLTTIEECAFHNCENLSKIIIPATVTEIGGCAFGWYAEGVSGKYENVSIYGYPGTASETYAIDYQIGFIPLDKGDADESTAVDINDVTCMQKIIAKITVTNDFKTANCDLNGDGKLNIRDATLLQLFLSKKIDKFPVQE